ncbi:MAG: cytochrome c biogenesis protein CcsA [Calditrichaeota bacterium]|nr:cytochrome c biogenesis protein CcsA [Calditrichota bacterium]
MKLIKNIFLSLETMVVLLVVFAVSIATATFIENDFGTETAKAVVYNAKWFELLLTLLVINLVANIFRYKMWKKGKRLSLIFHLSFIVIFLGAAATRYIGYEGTMHIREGSTSNSITSAKVYLQVKISADGKTIEHRKSLIMSSISGNYFSERIKLDGKSVRLRYKNFIPNAAEKVVAAEKGAPLLRMMISEGKRPESAILGLSDELRYHSVVFTFGKENNDPIPEVNIKIKNQGLVFISNSDVNITSMSDQSTTTLEAGKEHEFNPLVLYSIGATHFVLREYYPSATIKAVAVTKHRDGAESSALVLDVNAGDESQEVTLFGSRGMQGDPQHIKLANMDIDLAYGSVEIPLPFSLKLVDFQIDRYPGSNSPSSYASEVVLIDQEKGINEPFRIYMNHILNHRGLRFFQSSYDQDERGTILSVSYDPGTPITYIGYILLAFGLLLNFLNPKSRFRILGKQVRKIQAQKAALMITLLALTAFGTKADAQTATAQSVSILKNISLEHAKKFGELLIQDSQGRIKPMNSFAHEFMNKVSRKGSIMGLHPDQILLGMLVKPNLWQRVDMIRVKHPLLKNILGIESDQKRASFLDFFDPHTNQYKLKNQVEAAQRKQASMQNKFDKEILHVDERVSICYMIYLGHLLRIFPKPDDPNHTWYSFVNLKKDFPENEATYVTTLMQNYLRAVNRAMTDNNWTAADEALQKIKAYQTTTGAAVILSPSKIKAEIFFNEGHIFGRLTLVYLLMGFVLLILAFIKIFFAKANVRLLTRILAGILFIGFLVHIVGLALRWYVSGHAPWSNGYESMIYIAWATILAGFLFSKNEPMPLAATSILAGLTLFVAHLSWLDPQITNLVPVLKSYWLTIHVSMITASYGFLGLGSLLAFITLLLFAFKTKKNAARVELSIRELSLINEQTLIIGLVMLTIGNFLGAVWANESWGRYWGWDPKETWALVTILVYAVVIHLHMIPKLKSLYVFNIAALVSFCSVIMTYFGVNYYLSGLHSYAQGGSVPIPAFVYYTVATMALVILVAFRGRRMQTQLEA